MADPSACPDLVVILLGMRVEEPRGLQTLQTLGRRSRLRSSSFRRCGFETMYVDVEDPVGLARFAPSAPAHGPMFSARQRSDADRSDAAAT
jgi:hypothetical protein